MCGDTAAEDFTLNPSIPHNQPLNIRSIPINRPMMFRSGSATQMLLLKQTCKATAVPKGWQWEEAPGAIIRLFF
jgi:hypothetical protein